MNKLDLYNLALSLFDLHLDSLEIACKELRLMELNHDKVVAFCTKAWDFPFLLKRKMMTEGDMSSESYGDYLFGYRLPPDIAQVVALNGSNKHRYTIRFGVLWCDIADVEIQYLPSILETDEEGNYTAPADFLSLVAYQLALHAAPSLDPESQAMGNAAQLYQMTLANIKENEARSNDREHHFGASEGWTDDSSFDLLEYRRMLFEDGR